MPPSDSTNAFPAADRSLGRSIIAFAASPVYEKNVMNLGIAAVLLPSRSKSTAPIQKREARAAVEAR